MANVLNRTTLELRLSVHTPDYSSVDWIINPDLSQVSGISPLYWKISGDSVLAMTSQEQGSKDAALAAALKAGLITEGKGQVTAPIFRALVTVLVSELNILRNKAGLADRTGAQVVTALNNALDAQ